ncbi:hypothetical protein MNBD_CHLOROFLEXI01-2376 [hydrothermal vent metagenome]|uniref:Lipoprotein n=1 Tax=hydrothermal vent metagenome TaxID=652676 RepID=A0A3B0VBD9_9ZZZZ
MKHKLYIYKSYIALAIGVLIFLGGCEIKSPELTAMLESSASTTQLTTGREVSRRYQDSAKPLLGKPDRPEVRIEYEPINNYTKEDVYDEIVASLDENNWATEEVYIIRSGYYRASLPQDGFSILATVNIQSDRNIVSVRLRTVPR